MPVRKHMVEPKLRLSDLGHITSCWVPFRIETFKTAAPSAAGGTSGDRLHTLPEALNFFCLN